MKTIYTYVLVIVVALVAAYLTLEQKRKFEELQAVRLETIESNKTISANADAKEQELKTVKADFATVVESRDVLNASVESLKSTASLIQRDIDIANQSLAKVSSGAGDYQQGLTQLTEMMNELNDGITIDNIGDKVTALEEEKAERVAKTDELDVLISKTKELIATNTDELGRQQKREDERKARVARNAMEAVITGVNQDWGFLVIGAGSNSGFTPNNSLIVQRDGRMIGRVRPSSVEPTQTIAEINYKTLAPGVRIQPGDRVIFESSAAN